MAGTIPTFAGLTVSANTSITSTWGNLMRDSTVLVFASAAARDSQLTASIVREGMVCYLQDTDTIWVYRGTAWRQVAGPNQYKCYLSQTAADSIPAGGTFTAVNFDTEYSSGDPSGWHSTSVNTSRITPNVAGILGVAYSVSTGVTTSWATAGIRKNASSTVEYGQTQTPGPVGGGWALTGISYIPVNGSTDYVELWAGQGTAGSLNTDPARTFLFAWLEWS